MARDWNIIDDSEEPDAEPPRDKDAGLNTERIRLLTRERRAADRATLWRYGVNVLLVLAGLIVIVRVFSWLR